MRLTRIVHVVFLSPFDQRRVLTQDEMRDRSYSPRFGSELDRAETEEEAAEVLARRRARDGSDTFAVNAPSDGWKRLARVRALMVARNPESDKPEILGVASVTTKTRHTYQGTAELRIGPWEVFDVPITLDDILAELSVKQRSHLERILTAGESRPLPPATATEVRAAMRRVVPGLDGLLDRLPEPYSPVQAHRPASELPMLDASQTALRLFSRDWRVLEPVTDPAGPTAAASRLEYLARANENNFITDDASRFLDWDSMPGTVGGWFEFRKGDRQLLVKNIDVSTPEAKTGADLVYVSFDPDTVVLVQYKLLEELKTTGEMIFRDDGRLADQLDRVLRYSRTGDPDSGAPADARLGDDIGFVKFIESRDLRSDTARSVRPAGAYHPAELVSRMLKKPTLGPHGGPIHRVREWRSIDGETFARLVRDQWIGSRGDATDELFAILGLSPLRNPTVIAVEEPRVTTRSLV